MPRNFPENVNSGQSGAFRGAVVAARGKMAAQEPAVDDSVEVVPAPEPQPDMDPESAKKAAKAAKKAAKAAKKAAKETEEAEREEHRMQTQKLEQWWDIIIQTWGNVHGWGSAEDTRPLTERIPDYMDDVAKPPVRGKKEWNKALIYAWNSFNPELEDDEDKKEIFKLFYPNHANATYQDWGELKGGSITRKSKRKNNRRTNKRKSNRRTRKSNRRSNRRIRRTKKKTNRRRIRRTRRIRKTRR